MSARDQAHGNPMKEDTMLNERHRRSAGVGSGRVAVVRRASPDLRESEVRKAHKDRKATAARRASEASGAPLERGSRLACDPPPKRRPRTHLNRSEEHTS